MFYNSRIDFSERIDPAKRNNSKKCIIYHYWFLYHEFKFKILFLMVAII